MSEFIRKQHNVSILLYHIVCPAKYRKAIFTAQVDEKLKEICAEIALRYEIEFLEIGADNDHVHFLVQSVPSYSPTKIVRTIKSITAKEIFKQMPEVRKQMWGGEFWSDGYFISTVGSHGTEEMLKQYVKNQGKSNEIIQRRLF
jgi:REP element-mobilizing transposase RayT